MFASMIVFLLVGICFSQTVDKSLPNIPFIVEKEIVEHRDSKFELKKLYVFLEEKYFTRNNLQKLFTLLSNNRKNAVMITVFTDRQMLVLEIKGDETRMRDYPNTPDGNKAIEDFHEKNYPPELGYLRAKYTNNDNSEYFLYSPKSDSYQTNMVMLRDKRAFKPNNDFLFKAIKDGYFDAVKWSLAQSKQINIKDTEGRTPLMYAAWLQHYEIVKLLVEAGATINIIKDNDGTTAFHYACMGGDYETVKLMLSNKADIELVDNDGRTSLMYASHSCYETVVSQLLAYGSKVNKQDSSGNTALTYSCDNSAILLRLLSSIANPNLVAKDGTTAIFYAIENMQIKKIAILLESGASVNVKDKKGQTPLSLAEKLNDSSEKAAILELLKKFGSKKPLK
jgi:ankyrin repeat protein